MQKGLSSAEAAARLKADGPNELEATVKRSRFAEMLRSTLKLLVTTLLVTVIGIALPYSPAAAALGLAPLPAAYFVYLALALGAYLTLVEIVKHRVMRQLRDGPPAKPEQELVLRRA